MQIQTVHDVLAQFRHYSATEREKGAAFERLMAEYLVTDAVRKQQFQQVWTWSEWPDLDRFAEEYKLNRRDTGVDLVGLQHGGDYCAIQCKLYDEDAGITMRDLQGFLDISGKTCFASRMLIATVREWTENLENGLAGQTVRVEKVNLDELEASNVDWSQWSPDRIALPVQEKKSLRPYQERALADVLQGFQRHDRGKLIMACGTGKTLTGLRVVEAEVPMGGRVLFAVPSITLISQTLREWANQAMVPMRFYAVCSDSGIGTDQEDMRIHDLAYPSTTDAEKLFQEASPPFAEGITVILTTYQSMEVISAAQERGLPALDLVLCDEAHRTTGVELPEKTKESAIRQRQKKAEDKGKTYTPRFAADSVSAFVMVHNDAYIRARKRLYMTATPRMYTEKTKDRLEKYKGGVYSMDDEKIYGPEFHRLGFDEAVRDDILVDFKVLVVVMNEDESSHLANALVTENGLVIQTAFVSRIVGAWKALSKTDVRTEAGSAAFDAQEAPMRSAVAFAKTIKKSQELEKVFSQVVAQYLKHQEQATATTIEVNHVDGGMNANKRHAFLKKLKEAQHKPGHCQILTNARCLSEGVDVPSLDAVLFFDARDSMVDVIQAVGRVMRQSRDTGKKFGYIILPIGVSAQALQGKSVDDFVANSPDFKVLWKVLRALRSHDERLVDDSEYRKRVTVITDGGNGGGEGAGGGQIEIEFLEIPIDTIAKSVYAVIPDKLGDREYWTDWSKDVADVARNTTSRLIALLEHHAGAREAFDAFLAQIRETINPSVTRSDAVDMLVQHLITRPVFEALFSDRSFVEQNPVSNAMQGIVAIMDEHVLEKEAEGLQEFYASVEKRIRLAKSDKSKQDIIRNLYDTFFQAAFDKLASKLGIVYTPVEVVDFIIKSADSALQAHFGKGLADTGVNILDPFVGTGTFMTRLIQSGLIPLERLPYKYQYELHANEIVLLAYYIASINIESGYHALTGEDVPFNGIVLGDTFMMGVPEEQQHKIPMGPLEENSERAKHQDVQDIRVIIGNPPYSAQQDSENDNNKNLAYPALDDRIRTTYAYQSNAKLVKNLYDSYIRALRWASDRIKDKGVVAFVTNGSFLDANNMDGLRKCLTDEFSSLYVFNLRGNARTSGEQRQKERGNVFESGSRTPVAITVMVKDPAHVGPCELFYHDIGDYLDRERKLSIIESFQSIKSVPWLRITPNAEGDWINQRDPAFKSFMPLGSKDDESVQVVFETYSQGILSARDPWAYNFSRFEVEANMRRMIDNYNSEVDRYALACTGKGKEQWPEVENVIDTDPKRINWTHNLKADAKREKRYAFESVSLVPSMYRPFTRQWLYFNRRFNERVYQMPHLFPTSEHKNFIISATGTGASKAFSALVSDCIPNYHMHDTGQCFPRYWYEKVETDPNSQIRLFGEDEEDAAVHVHGYVRHDAITDAALEAFYSHYQDVRISKDDLFWYVYGLLHSPEYKQRFGADLKKMLPRIPFTSDFWAFSMAGHKLGEWHLSYEAVEPWPVTEVQTSTVPDYRVAQMKFGKTNGKPEKGVIVFNEHLILQDVPLEAYEYVVNGKPAIEWIMERYAITEDPDSEIRNDPNDWSDDPRYILDLLKRVVRVSVESIRIIKSLPSPEFDLSVNKR